MKKYCVIGSGRQGTAAAYDIVSHGKPKSLTVIDSNNHNLEKCKNKINAKTVSNLTFSQLKSCGLSRQKVLGIKSLAKQIIEKTVNPKLILKMTSISNEYFHKDGSLPLFNGSNNIYTKNIYNSLNKENYLKKRDFANVKNGIAFYSDKNKKVFFDVVQPNKDMISSNLSAGTLSIELSGLGEKIITNCGASESFGKNPEYLRYSAAHSTIILQNTNVSEIKENNPHIKYPQSVVFNKENNHDSEIFEGSHNGYAKKFNKIIKRKLILSREWGILQQLLYHFLTMAW